MKEFNLEGVENTNNGSNLPTKKGFWGSFKGFWLQEIDLNKPITLSPKAAKVIGEVHDFWCQDINFSEFHDFLFQEVDLSGVRDFWFQEVDLSGVHDFLFQEVHLFGNKKNK